MAMGKQELYVVVWEWENKQRRWRPYTPEVTQILERAFAKHLRTVLLGDSDPSLKDFCINLSDMLQENQKTKEKVPVRRNFFPQSSPAGQGAVWQWAGDNGDWHVYDMCVQCVIESAWATGVERLDLSNTFPLCPYIIDFCSLAQKNSRTGFVRRIRRIQLAAYPVGKRPATPLLVKQEPEMVAAADRSRRRSRDDADSNSDGKSRPFFKLPWRNGGGCTGGTSSSRSPPLGYEGSDNRVGGGTHSKGGRVSGSPPKPLPRSQVPPKPKPRTTVEHPYTGSSSFVPSHRQNRLSPDRGHYQQERDNSRMHAPRMLRNEHVDYRFGSNRTLDSDCSSMSGRRPSVDTTSTYLSMDSNNDDHASMRYHNRDDRNGHDNHVVDNLVRLSPSENMDDDVFSTDEEVCDVMQGIVNNSPRRISASPPRDHQRSRQYYHNRSPSPKQQSQDSYLFSPISSPGSHPDPEHHLNGVKRKRFRDQAAPQHESPKNSTEGDYFIHRHGHSHHSLLHQGSRAPIGPEDKLLLQYTRTVLQPSDEMCSICMWSLQESSGFSDDEDQTPGISDTGVVSLTLCEHKFHEACIRQMVKATPQFLECPNCKTMHGEKQGIQPKGTMRVTNMPQSLPGYKGCGTIQIQYCINDGIQGDEHPHPGRPYHAIGFPRTAYLPNNEKGKKVLNLLREAFNRKLIFTIGTSVTTGAQDVVTWNEIHHKTEWHNATGHGYPDPNYLDNVLMELAVQGVSETTLV